MNPSCPSESEKPIQRPCQAQKSTDGQPCGNQALKGQTVCGYHGGNAPQVKAAAARRVAAAKIAKTEEKAIDAARIKLNIPADVDPTGALLEALWRASVLVGFWQSRVELISADDAVVPDALNAGIARPRIEILRYEAAVERLAEFAKLAIATGLAERQVRVIEEQGRLMDRAMRAVLDDLDLTADQRNAAPAIIRRRVLELVPGLESELADTP